MGTNNETSKTFFSNIHRRISFSNFSYSDKKYVSHYQRKEMRAPRILSMRREGGDIKICIVTIDLLGRCWKTLQPGPRAIFQDFITVPLQLCSLQHQIAFALIEFVSWQNMILLFSNELICSLPPRKRKIQGKLTDGQFCHSSLSSDCLC